jgi:hypothetical protein
MTMKFSSPVWIHERGLTFRAISTAEEAFAFLKGWRGARAAIYDHALRTMEAAMLDEIDTVTNWARMTGTPARARGSRVEGRGVLRARGSLVQTTNAANWPTDFSFL